MTDSVCQKKALKQAREIKESGRRRVDGEEGLVWAMTRHGRWREWHIYVEGHPRSRRIGSFLTTNIAVIKAVVDALEPFQAKELL